MAERSNAAVLKTVDPKGPGVRIPLSPLSTSARRCKQMQSTENIAFQDRLNKIPEFEELAQLIKYEIQQSKRPAEEVILDDVDLRNFLKVSKRTIAYWREKAWSLIAS